MAALRCAFLATTIVASLVLLTMPLLDILTKTGLAPASTGLQRIGELLSKCSQQQSFQSLRSLISRISETKLLPNSLAMLNTLSVPLAAMVCFAIVFKLRVFISSILRATRRVSSSSRASPKDIVQRIHVDHNRLKKLEIELESRDKVIQKLRSQLEGERATITRQQNTISTINGQHKSINAQVRKVEQRNRDQGKHITALNAQISTLQASIAGQRNTAAQLSNAIVQSNNREIDAKNRERIAIQELHEVRKQNTEMQFDLELLRCTASQSSVVSHETASDLQAFALPFVMVIVDGDAYSWSNDHFNQERIPAGAHAAQAIKANVQQYLLSNDNRLPLTCKIVTRVYQNAGWALRNNTARGLASRQGRVQEFPLHFTESMPLFDYVDCGNGKERADSKIQGLSVLFPLCQSLMET